MLNFGQLRTAVLKESGIADWHTLERMSPAHERFSDALLHREFILGHPCCSLDVNFESVSELKTLTEKEHGEWLYRFRKIHHAVRHKKPQKDKL